MNTAVLEPKQEPAAQAPRQAPQPSLAEWLEPASRTSQATGPGLLAFVAPTALGLGALGAALVVGGANGPVWAAAGVTLLLLGAAAAHRS